MPYYGYGGYGYYGWDPTFIILVPAILFTIYAQFKVSSTTSRFLRVNTQRGFTGEQVARRILESNGLYDVRIEMVRGHLSDHYDPRNKVLRLSQDIYYGTSVTSVAVAAHECGHAIQHAKGYVPLNLRSSLVPVVNFASNISWLLIALGFIIRGPFLEICILLVQLGDLGIVEGKELSQSRKVLTAAALTYVAAALTSVLQLLRLVAIANRDND